VLAGHRIQTLTSDPLCCPAAALLLLFCNPFQGAGARLAAECNLVLAGHGIQALTLAQVPNPSALPALPVDASGLPAAAVCGIGYYSAGGYCVQCPSGAVTLSLGAKSIEECGKLVCKSDSFSPLACYLPLPALVGSLETESVRSSAHVSLCHCPLITYSTPHLLSVSPVPLPPCPSHLFPSLQSSLPATSCKPTPWCSVAQAPTGSAG
jgi:hypothetical protein